MTDRRTASWVWGPFSRPGLLTASVILALDQAHKWWMLLAYDIQNKPRATVAPFVDFVYKLNTGISFSLMDASSYTWQIFLSCFAVLASLGLWIWLARGGTSRLMAISLGLIIGGALSNAIDRIVLGGVLDYVQPHAFGIYWPTVFNLADVAIVAGVVGLLYESLITSRNDASNVT